MGPECLSGPKQMGVIGVNASIGVCLLLMAHHCRQADRIDP